ncbi:MAG: HlyD family secretion protein [Caulobacteraceae bacterium]
MSSEARQGSEPERRRGLFHRPALVALIVVVIIAVIIAAVLWWLHARHYESTNDAFIDAHIVHLAPQVSGRVVQVLADDNELVRAGQKLAVIDSADNESKLTQMTAQRQSAMAQVAEAEATIAVDQANFRQAQADARAAAAPARKAALDLARYRRLEAMNTRAVAAQQLDEAHAAAQQTAGQYDAALRLAASRKAQLAAARTQISSAQSQERAAEAELAQAGIALGRDEILAPIDGHVAQRTVAVGDYVQPGTELMAIVPLKLWVTANFKETQLPLMRPGQKVRVKIDACPERAIDGRVDSIQRGAGQAFAILPPQNATGNFVKVVQRVPVKIVLDRIPPDCPLGPGMSVEPTVKVR